jgi:hypothetical protein
LGGRGLDLPALELKAEESVESLSAVAPWESPL